MGARTTAVKALLASCARLIGKRNGQKGNGLDPATLDLQQLPVLPAADLLQVCGYPPDLPDLFRLVGVQQAHFNVLYKAPTHALAEAVQLAPASESHHHAGPGGLLKHTLEVVHNALKLRKAYQLPRHGSPDDIATQEHAWTYAVFAGALLHDVGKVMCRSQLVLTLPDGTPTPWTPHDRPLRDLAPASYRIVFRDVPYKTHQQFSMTLFSVLLPASARAWLARYPHILSQLVNYLWGDEYESQDIGEIVVRADRDSTARNLGAAPEAVRFPGAAPSTADQLISALRQLLAEKALKLNQNGAVGWIKDGVAYFVCKPLAETLQAHLQAQGVSGIPTETSRLYDVLQEGGYALPTPDGKAIWTVTVADAGEEYRHTLTCLKFTARRLYTHRRLPPAFTGTITVGGLPAAPSPTDTATPAATPDANATPVTAAIPVTSAPTGMPPSPVRPDGAPAPSPATATASPTRPAQAPAPTAPPHPAPARASTPPAPEPSPRTPPVSAPDAAVPATPLTWNDDVVAHFLRWIRNGIHTKTLPANNSKAAVHFVEAGIFLVSPLIFKKFCEHTGLGIDNYNRLQKRFVRKGLHVKGTLTQKHVLVYQVQAAGGKQVGLNGILLPFSTVFTDGDTLPDKNRFLTPSPNN